MCHVVVRMRSLNIKLEHVAAIVTVICALYAREFIPSHLVEMNHIYQNPSPTNM